MLKYIFYICFFTSSMLGLSLSNNERINQLENELEIVVTDTAKVRIYCDLARLSRTFDLKKSEEYSTQAFVIAQNSGDKLSVSKAINSLALTRVYKGNYDEGLFYIEKSFEILNADTVNYNNNTYPINELLGTLYNSYGTVFDFQGKYAKSVKYYLKAMNLFKTIDKKEGLAVSYNNLGISYLYINELDKSESYFQKSFNLYIELKDTNVAYQARMNLGIINYYHADFDKAINIFKECEQVMGQIGNIRSQGHCLTNIGEVFKEKQQFDSSLVYIKKGIEVDKILEDTEGLSADYRILGSIYEEMASYELAREYYLKSLDLSQEIDRSVAIRDSYLSLYRIEKKTNNSKLALDYHEKYKSYSDSVMLESNSRKLGKVEAESEFNQKIAIQKIENDKLLEIEEQKRKQQTTVLYFTVGLIVVILFFVFMVYRSLVQTKKQKELVQEAKLEIEEKNRELIDSIKYAKRIQFALLKDDKEGFNSLEHFILFKPKDIVSGDFYWTYKINNYWYVAAADCTGHGVPGALLTMLGTAFLNEICAENSTYSPADILNKLKSKITNELSQTGVQGESKDGMDISLLRVDLETQAVEWAGANNSLYMIREGELNEIKPNKQPIGYSDNPIPFDNHKITTKKGDLFYLFTDGFADQFGGPKGKKFKYSNFKKELLKSSEYDLSRQKQSLNETLVNWQGDLEQLDDICIIGLKI